MTLIEAPTLGEGWLAASRAILERGEDASSSGSPTQELALLGSSSTGPTRATR